MVESRRSFSAFVALGVVAMALLGYLAGVAVKSAGHAHAEVAPAAQQVPVSGAGVQFGSSSGWQRAAAGAPIPGLVIADQVTLGPAGDAASAGLITGHVRAGLRSPLPSAFAGRLLALRGTRVVNLSQTQAFKYTGVRVAGFDAQLTLYAIPGAARVLTVLACYAARSAADELSTCEQIVSSLRPVGATGSQGLAPDPSFAARVGTAIGALDSGRVAMRREMHLEATGATLGRAATALADRFAAAAVSLAKLLPPRVAQPATAALVRGLRRARDSYSALSTAAAAAAVAPYEAARTRVYAAESEVDAALANFALLGYGHR